MVPRWLGVAAALLLGGNVAAQDLQFVGPQWLEAADAPDALPIPPHLSAPPVQEALGRLADPHYAEFRLLVTEKGELVFDLQRIVHAVDRSAKGRLVPEDFSASPTGGASRQQRGCAPSRLQSGDGRD